MTSTMFMQPNGKVAGGWLKTQQTLAAVYEEICEVPMDYETEPSTETMVGNSVYARVPYTAATYPDNSLTSSACDWYGSEGYGVGTGGIVQADYGTGYATDSIWLKVENGWDNFGEKCNSKVLEWKMVSDSCDATTLGTSGWKEHIYNNAASATSIHYKVKYGGSCWVEDGYLKPKMNPASRLRQMIASRQAPMIITGKNRNPLKVAADIREERARETLRRVLGESKFRNYVSNGFVSVKAKSGLVYQIFPGHGISCVFDRGKMVERLCVVLKGDFPPTDSLIMRYLMILNNEQQFRGYGIPHSVNQVPKQTPKIDQRPLTEIFREIKGAA